MILTLKDWFLLAVRAVAALESIGAMLAIGHLSNRHFYDEATKEQIAMARHVYEQYAGKETGK